MTYLLCLLIGMMAGAAGAYLACERARRSSEKPVSLNGVRWERSVPDVVPSAVKHMRRYYPTHELVTGCPFMGLVEARGSASEAVRRRCDAWVVGMVMVDRRTAAISRIVLWNEDEEIEEKTWILRRAGYRVTTMDRHTTETSLVEAMAA